MYNRGPGFELDGPAAPEEGIMLLEPAFSGSRREKIPAKMRPPSHPKPLAKDKARTGESPTFESWAKNQLKK